MWEINLVVVSQRVQVPNIYNQLHSYSLHIGTEVTMRQLNYANIQEKPR